MIGCVCVCMYVCMCVCVWYADMQHPALAIAGRSNSSLSPPPPPPPAATAAGNEENFYEETDVHVRAVCTRISTFDIPTNNN